MALNLSICPLLLVALTRLLSAPPALAQAVPQAPPVAPVAPVLRTFARDELYFGLSKPDGTPVSDQEWQDYLAEVVTPRFPDGLTVIEANGQFRPPGGSLVRERSRVIVLLYPSTPTTALAIGELVREYKRRFRQLSVLYVHDTVQAAF